jgi:hypothetical protein
VLLTLVALPIVAVNARSSKRLEATR